MAVPVAMIPTALLLTVAYFVAIAFGVGATSMAAPDKNWTLIQALGTIVFSPIVETGLMALVLRYFDANPVRPFRIPVISAIVWGGLHAMFHPLWFFGTLWSFFVQTCGYMAWKKISLRHAFIAAAVPHASINAIVFVLLAIEQGA